MRELSLGGEWRFREAGNGDYMTAAVPGCNYLDLMALDKLKDPFVGLNEADTLWVAEKDWEYERTFFVSDDLLREDVALLTCGCLDTLCDIYINETKAGSSRNCFLPYCQDVKRFLKEGENTIRIVFFSPIRYIEEKQKADKMPRNNNGMSGIPHIRKTQCHFGWDWGPVIPVSGIAGKIGIQFYSSYKLGDLRIAQSHHDGVVDLTVDPTVEALASGGTYQLKTKLISPSGEVLEVRESESAGKTDFTIRDPELWWTNDLSLRKTQPLYTVEVTLKQNGAPLDSISKKIGLRTIRLDRSDDKYGQNFKFVLNGVDLFAKGANYIPPDSMITRFTAADREKLVQSCAQANMNIIRVWGGGNYETDEFYDYCDQYGILVWQDFMFACQPYPFYDEALLANVKEEVVANVRRLRHHASLALWCGNNELEVMSIAWRTHKKLMDWTEKFFYHILPELVNKNDGETSFIAGSPIGREYMKGFSSDKDGDTHLWAVWHGLQPLTYYRKSYTRFCSEFGLESMPCRNAVDYFAQGHDLSLTSKTFNAHQKSPSGNQKMLFYIAEKYRIPNQFDDLLYMTQLIQAEGVRDAVEHWRRNRGRCNGAIYWQLNDCWPVNSWAGMDYLGDYKALHYAARRFNEPVAVSVQDTKKQIKLFVVNDRIDKFSGVLKYKVIDFGGKILKKAEQEVSVPGASSECIATLNVRELLQGTDKRRAFLYAELLRDGTLISSRITLFAPEKKLQLPKCNYGISAQIGDGRATVTIKSDLFARSVFLYSPCASGNFSDNFLDILPGGSITVTVPVKDDVTPDSFLGSLTVKSIADITDVKSALTGVLTRLKILLIPINFGNWIYYRAL